MCTLHGTPHAQRTRARTRTHTHSHTHTLTHACAPARVHATRRAPSLRRPDVYSASMNDEVTEHFKVLRMMLDDKEAQLREQIQELVR